MIHRHHRKRRSQGGDDSPTNVINISDSFHQWIHENPALAYDLGLLVRAYEDPAARPITIPEQFASAKKPRAKKLEAPKERKVTSIRTPKDEENVLPDLIEEARVKLAKHMGWQDDVPAYFVIVAALALVLQTELD